jgi:hypothetical protein
MMRASKLFRNSTLSSLLEILENTRNDQMNRILGTNESMNLKGHQEGARYHHVMDSG